MNRSRCWYFVAVLAVIATGLASRRFPGVLPAALGKYPGDVLWALMVYLGWGFVLPKASIARIAGCAALACVTIETLKLYQAPWMVSVRHSTLGHLVFGHVFAWQNLVAYAVGVAIGVSVELALATYAKNEARAR